MAVSKKMALYQILNALLDGENVKKGEKSLCLMNVKHLKKSMIAASETYVRVSILSIFYMHF